ncbi:hypothetical protein [Streptomyces tropicalis]|uniref:Secreted protein n=1 Tax=Streptomyces tropicalis TaxID=3034234 RepID=A0ABT6A1G4_9ACTN|nr:hypothetical protein [Streptomyces tropicalis]MDF3298478.1 hypothetical protein [Streptomyces tropicalis]
MFRGRSARTVLALLAALLLSLPFLAATPAFASAHTPRHVEARTATGTHPAAATPCDGKLTPHDCGPSGAPTHPLRTRERQRTADCAPQAPERSTRTAGPAAHEAAGSGALPSRTPGPPAGRTPAALQVFRC